MDALIAATVLEIDNKGANSLKSEKALHKVIFAALYAKEESIKKAVDVLIKWKGENKYKRNKERKKKLEELPKEDEVVEWYPEDEEYRMLVPDYRVYWYGVYSDIVRDRIDKLSKNGVIAYGKGGILTIKNKDALEEMSRKLPADLRKKIETTVEHLKKVRNSNELEDVVNMIIGIYNEFGKSLLFGVNLNEYVARWRAALSKVRAH